MFFYSLLLKYMANLAYLYRWKSRDLRKIIIALLKSWCATEIKKVNYVQNFVLVEANLEKIEMKILIITTENEEKLVEFLSKNFSQIQRVYLN